MNLPADYDPDALNGFTEADFDLADRLYDAITGADAGTFLPPSAWGRKARVASSATGRVLEALRRGAHVAAVGNGAWTRYGARP